MRVNEAEKVRAARVPSLLWLSAMAGGGLVLFIVGLFAPKIGAYKQHGLIDMHLESL